MLLMWFLSFLSFPTVNCSLDSVKWATRFGTLSNSSTSEGGETFSFIPVHSQISHPCHSIERAISCTWADFNNNFNLNDLQVRENANHWPFWGTLSPCQGFHWRSLFELGNWGRGEGRQHISGNKGTSYNWRDQKVILGSREQKQLF